MDSEKSLFSNSELASYFAKVKEFFSGDHEKAIAWFEAKNPNLGGMSPLQMVQSGRGSKLYKWIDTRLADNMRNEGV